MSLILDALNRSRQDAEPMPGLTTRHYQDDAPRPGNARQWLLLSALVIAALVITWLLLERTQETAPPPPELVLASPGPAAAVPEPVQATTEQSAVAAPRPAAQQVAEPAPVVEPAPVPADVVEPKVIAARDSQPARAAPRVDASVDALYRQQQLAAPARPVAQSIAESEQEAPAPEPAAAVAALEEEPVDIEQLLVAAEEDLKNARLAEHSAPFLATLSQQTKDAIPTLLYQRHDYASNEKTSSVLINGKTLRQGGSASGVRVEEILPDSVVLSYQGKQFRLRALSSWVNL